MATMPARVFRMNQESPSSRQIVPKTAAYQMVPRDTLVKVNPTGGAFTVTLPPVAQCAGGLYTLKSIATTIAVTIVDKGDANFAVSVVLNAATEAVIFYCDGEQWYNLFNAAL